MRDFLLGSFRKVCLYAGFVKDSGLDVLFPAIQKCREDGTIVDLIVGLDKKNTSKDMLLKLLNIGCRIRFFRNDEEHKLETRVYAFESEEGVSYVYLAGSKLSEGGLTTNFTLITEISFLKEEKREWNRIKLAIENSANCEEFQNLTGEVLKKMATEGEIQARITERKIPKIHERYAQQEQEQVQMGVQEYDESTINYHYDLPKKEVCVDIDVMPKEGVFLQNTFGTEESENVLKNEQSKEDEGPRIPKIVLNDKELPFENMSTFIMIIGKEFSKNKLEGEVKIPAIIFGKMKTFFDYPNSFYMEKDEKGNDKEISKIALEIFENASRKEWNTSEAYFVHSEKFLSICDKNLVNVNIEEKDIIRFIKEGEQKFRLEIIKQESDEYPIWEKFCDKSIKGSSKKIGIL